jgi:hypothetical protein
MPFGAASSKSATVPSPHGLVQAACETKSKGLGGSNPVRLKQPGIFLRAASPLIRQLISVLSDSRLDRAGLATLILEVQRLHGTKVTRLGMVRDRPFARFLPVESLLRGLGFSDYVHPGSLLVKATRRAGYRRSNVLQERKGCRSNHIGLAAPDHGAET